MKILSYEIFVQESLHLQAVLLDKKVTKFVEVLQNTLHYKCYYWTLRVVGKKMDPRLRVFVRVSNNRLYILQPL